MSEDGDIVTGQVVGPSFKLGDVVHLKSGGQTMTVSDVRLRPYDTPHDVPDDRSSEPMPDPPTIVRCMWHTTDGYVQLADFPPEALVRYSTDDEAEKVRAAQMADGLVTSDTTMRQLDDWRKSRGL